MMKDRNYHISRQAPCPRAPGSVFASRQRGLRGITAIVVFLLSVSSVRAGQDEDLIAAAEVGDLAEMSALLAHGANPNFRDSFGNTALTNIQTVIGYAEGDKQIQSIQFLL